MRILQKIIRWTVSLLVILVLGSLGYVWVEGWNFFDALYMTVTTLTTVGYGEVHPLSRVGRIYNIFLILAGVGFLLYLVSALARVVVEGEIKEALGKRKLLSHIKKIKNHYIICGFGRIGEIIARQLKNQGIPVVVVENDEKVVPRLEESGYPFIWGDATREEVLREAGIARAKGLVAVVSSDAGNVYITLTARSVNPQLYIVARGEELGSEQKLLRAGANKVVSPYEIGGRKMAETILRPAVTTFIELAMHEGVDWSMEEITVGPDCALCGVSLKDSEIRQKLNLIVVGIKRIDGEMIFNPAPDTAIQAGDILITLGVRQNLETLEKMLGSSA